MNRTLKSKLKSTTLVSSMTDENSPNSSKHDGTSTKLLECVSPKSKKKVKKKEEEESVKKYRHFKKMPNILFMP